MLWIVPVEAGLIRCRGRVNVLVARFGFVEKTAGEGRNEVLVGASFRDVSVEDERKAACAEERVNNC